ncbi:MAG: hypothetical protein E7617_01985 [Ruminococcaceae bacterium]|nr:hypothetical protein [Oscillospiraceae bacterium]
MPLPFNFCLEIYTGEGQSFNGTLLILILSAVLAVIMKGLGFRGASIFTALIYLVLVRNAVAMLSEISGVMRLFASESGAEKYITAAARVIGVGYLGYAASEVCRELGENGISGAILTATRMEMILSSLPFIKEIFNIAVDLIG